MDANCQVVFSSISDEMKKQPRLILQSWKVINSMLRENLTTFAQCDFAIPKAELMLLHFGFRPFDGKIWRRE